MPTLLRCYSQRQTSKLFCGVVEFLCKQFYILHRKPFVLQMCGAVANLLDESDDDFEINPHRVKAKYFFGLLKAMENMKDMDDQLDILGLVPHPKPLKVFPVFLLTMQALDLCYRDDPNTFCVLTDAVASCICVCGFAPESRRAAHMLVCAFFLDDFQLVMQALLPHVMRRIEEETTAQNNSPASVKHELHLYTTLCVEVKALIHSCDVLARQVFLPSFKPSEVRRGPSIW